MEVISQKRTKMKEITINIENQPTIKSIESKKDSTIYIK